MAERADVTAALVRLRPMVNRFMKDTQIFTRCAIAAQGSGDVFVAMLSSMASCANERFCNDVAELIDATITMLEMQGGQPYR